MLSVGDQAPDFEGDLSDGRPFRLRDYRGRRHVVLYFFPKDFTPGCTREACAFRDARAQLAALDAEVVGVSTDRSETHGKFAQTYNLTFPLVSDRSGDIAAAYGVARLGGWLPTKRVTFVIDKTGVVRHTIASELSIARHIDDAIDALKLLLAA